MTIGLGGMVVFVLVAIVAWLLNVGESLEEDRASQVALDPLAGEGVLGRLPDDVVESSGVAVSRADSTLLWTHNDGADGRAFLIRRDGTLVGTVAAQTGEVEDVEDIAVGDCPQDMSAPSCLYLADIGDNSRTRESYVLLVAPEPSSGEVAAAGEALQLRFTRIRYRYPDGSHDAESLTLTPDGDLLVITKGTAEAFRVPVRLGISEAVPVAQLPIDVSQDLLQPTGAALSPSGNTVAVRSDGAVFLFAPDDLTRVRERCEVPDAEQGEGVDFLDEQRLVLTNEGQGAVITVLRCPRGPPA